MMGDREVVEDMVDITDLSKFVFTSDYAEWMVSEPEKWLEKEQHYPVRQLVKSIKERGFIPNFPDVTYHREIFHDFPLALVLFEGRDGKYRVPGGVHRLAAARLAGLKEIRCYVVKEKKYSKEQIDEFREVLDFMKENSNCKYQSWVFPGGLRLDGRDDSERIFNSFKLPVSVFAGRTVLDIACNTGFFAIKAGLLGASKIAGFDVSPEVIKAAKLIAKAYRLKCEYDFQVCEFWDYPFDEEYDIVFCNQSLYHFTSRHRSKCLGSIDDMLDKICGATGRALLMYTYVDVREPPSKDGGYYPSSPQLKADLICRGFKKVVIAHVYGPKKHVIAIKNYNNVVAPCGVIGW